MVVHLGNGCARPLDSSWACCPLSLRSETLACGLRTLLPGVVGDEEPMLFSLKSIAAQALPGLPKCIHQSLQLLTPGHSLAWGIVG